MIDILQAAGYISGRYRKEKGSEIGAEELQRLLYFSQRESYIRSGEPLFADNFEAAANGPVVDAVEEARRAGRIGEDAAGSVGGSCAAAMDEAFDRYACRSLWTQNMLACSDSAYENARGVREGTGPRRGVIDNEDIRHDAEVLKTRRDIIEGPCG